VLLPELVVQVGGKPDDAERAFPGEKKLRVEHCAVMRDQIRRLSGSITCKRRVSRSGIRAKEEGKKLDAEVSVVRSGLKRR
jgi:hypothetical protein